MRSSPEPNPFRHRFMAGLRRTILSEPCPQFPKGQREPVRKRSRDYAIFTLRFSESQEVQ